MNNEYVDLHTHTTASDGMQRPRENVRLAKLAGLSAVAITDHDTISGVSEAIIEGQLIGVQVVPGVEISTVSNGQDIHILGYYIDIHDQHFLDRLDGLKDTRNIRNQLIVDRLRLLGIEITMDELISYAQIHNKREGDTIGRPHIAEVLLAKGYVSSIAEAFERYLGKSGQAYANPPRIHPFEAVDWIRSAGGSAVIAHPGLYDDDKLIDELIRYGIDGIEAFHADHSPEQEAYYSRLCAEHHLIATAGSDFHGERGGIPFHAQIGSKKTSVSVLSLLIK